MFFLFVFRGLLLLFVIRHMDSSQFSRVQSRPTTFSSYICSYGVFLLDNAFIYNHVKKGMKEDINGMTISCDNHIICE